MRHEPRIISKTKLGCETLRLRQERIIDAPAHFRIRLEKLGPQTFAGRRMNLLHQEGESGAAVGGNPGPELRQIFFESGTIARLEVFDLLSFLLAFALLDEAPGTRGIIEIEKRGLGKRVGRSPARRVE